METGSAMNSKTLLAAAAIALAATPAFARPDTRRMSCGQAQAYVRQAGAVIMSTGQYTYERFVSGMGYCGPLEETRLLTAPTLDNPRCRVGYICQATID
jgi:hypothetical protein